MDKKRLEEVKIWSSIATLVSGIVLCFISLFIPPNGVIDSSVLIALGELLTFTGSVWGIGQYSSLQIHKINNEAGKILNEKKGEC